MRCREGGGFKGDERACEKWSFFFFGGEFQAGERSVWFTVGGRQIR